MKDQYSRKINYARISLTDKCNLRCRYCMPKTGVSNISAKKILTFEEIYFIIDILKKLEVTKFRFTGGELFTRKNVMEFLKNINLDEFYITTSLSVENLDINLLNNLKLKGINVSLDTLKAEKYKWITRRGNLNTVISNLKKLRCPNVKINTIIMSNFNENEVEDIINFAVSIKATVRFIEKMDFIKDNLKSAALDKIKKDLLKKGIIEKEMKVNSTAVYHRLKNAEGMVGFITPISDPFCRKCNKIRIKADGSLKSCLFENEQLNLKDFAGSSELKNILQKAIFNKPLKMPQSSYVESMANIGG